MITNLQLAAILKRELAKETAAPQIDNNELEKFLEQYNGDDRIVSSLDILAEVKKTGIRKGMSTGMPNLDKILGGFFEEQVIVLMARPKSGKTSFSLFIADKMKDCNPLFIAIEQSPRELIEQMVEKEMAIPEFYTPQKIEGIQKTLDWVHLKIVESQYRAQKAGRLPTKLVIIDHFGYLDLQQTAEHMTYGIINAMRELKEIAVQTKTAIVTIVHTTKGDPERAPTTEDLFGSAGYHQAADTVLSLWRQTFKKGKSLQQTNNVLLQVLANRRKGVSGAIKLQFQNGHFLPVEWEEDGELETYLNE